MGILRQAPRSFRFWAEVWKVGAENKRKIRSRKFRRFGLTPPDRPELRLHFKRAIDEVAAGDTLVVWKLGGSLRDYRSGGDPERPKPGP
jgi:hypothetical protein